MAGSATIVEPAYTTQAGWQGSADGWTRGAAEANDRLCRNHLTCPRHSGQPARSAAGWMERGVAEANDRLCHDHPTRPHHWSQPARSADGRTKGVAEADDRLCHNHLTRSHHWSQPARLADGWTERGVAEANDRLCHDHLTRPQPTAVCLSQGQQRPAQHLSQNMIGERHPLTCRNKAACVHSA